MKEMDPAKAHQPGPQGAGFRDDPPRLRSARVVRVNTRGHEKGKRGQPQGDQAVKPRPT